MAKETILIGCRLPNGIVLQHPKNPNITVELAGTYGKKTEAGIYLPPVQYSTTAVDAEFWAEYQRLGGTVIKSFNEYEYFLDLFLKLTGAKIGMDIPLPSHLGFDVFGITLDFYYSYQCGEFNRNRIANDYDIYDIFVASIDNIHPYS